MVGEISMSNFMQNFISGKVGFEDIDDFIGTWHESDTDLPLPEFLGMTDKEYEMWVENPKRLLKKVIDTISWYRNGR